MRTIERGRFHDAVVSIRDAAEKKAFIAEMTARFRERAAALDPAKAQNRS